MTKDEIVTAIEKMTVLELAFMEFYYAMVVS